MSSLASSGAAAGGIPTVVAMNDADRNGNIDDVDPALRQMLDGKVRLRSLAEALEDKKTGGPLPEGVMTLSHAPLNGELLDALGGAVRVVSNYGVGYDHVDAAACTARGVVVGNTPGVLDEAVADHTMALVLAAARRIPECDRFARGAGYTRYDNMCLLGKSVAGQTIGIVGLGRIGRRVAWRANKGFGMKVLYHNRSRNADGEAETGADLVPLDGLLRRSDFVVLLCPKTPATTGLIGREQLALMKPTATLVNVARGPVVDTDALVEALDSGQIASAALDVFDPEPLPRDHPLNAMDSVVMTPHRGSATRDARRAMAQRCVDNLLLGLAGKPLISSPNQDALAK